MDCDFREFDWLTIELGSPRLTGPFLRFHSWIQCSHTILIAR